MDKWLRGGYMWMYLTAESYCGKYCYSIYSLVRTAPKWPFVTLSELESVP